MGAQGIAIAGANMWALLLDKDPGNSAAANELAFDVVHRKLKKTAAAVVKVEETPPPGNVTKTAKRGEKARTTKKGAVFGSSKEAAAHVVEVAKLKNNRVKKEKKGHAGEHKQDANVHDREVQINGAGDSKQTAEKATVSDGDELTNAREEIKKMLAAVRRIEEEAQKEKVFIDVVPKGSGRRQTVAGQVPKPAVPEGVTVTGANMWALLSDDDPGHGSAGIGNNKKHTKAAAAVPDIIAEEEEAAPAHIVRAGPGGVKPPKRGKKTNKTKKKKKEGAAGNRKQAEHINGHEEKQTPASELEEEISEEEEEVTHEDASGGSRCRTVAWRVCRAAVAVAMLAMYFQLGSTPTSCP